MNPDKASMGQKLLAISGTLALIAFLALGFAFGAWAWAWIVFLVPGMVRTWMAVEAPNDEPHGYGINERGEEKPYPHP